MADAAIGDETAWRSNVVLSIEGNVRNGDVLPAAMDASYAAECASGLRLPTDALYFAEKSLSLLEGTTAVNTQYEAQLARAVGLLSLAESAPAVETAGVLGEWAASVGARKHHLVADLILAETDMRAKDFAGATARLRVHADYIPSESANLTLAMYIRAFPTLLAPVTAAVGTENLPVHMLQLILPEYAEEAVAAASDVLRPAELEAISRRLLGRTATGRRSSDRKTDDTCQIRLFGGFEVAARGRVIPDASWPKRKSRLLLAMLAVRRGNDVPRDEIIEHLWPEMSPERGLNNFYVVWSVLRQTLTPGLPRGEACPYVEHVGKVCRTTGAVRVDLDEFEAQIEVASKARLAGDEEAELAALLAAGELYRGDLLPSESYDDWFAALRDRCKHSYEDAMLRAASLLESRGDAHGALGLARRALDKDPWREDLYQAVLRLQIAAGQRSAAIETYLSCRSRLVDDLGIDPSIETTRLYERVLSMEDWYCPGFVDRFPLGRLGLV